MVGRSRAREACRQLVSTGDELVEGRVGGVGADDERSWEAVT
jgi:hypothetical protein